jgi:hypothetical protein
MYQHPAALDYAAAYQQDEALRHAKHRQLEREAEADNHTSAEHRVIAAAVAMLMLLVMVAVI